MCRKGISTSYHDCPVLVRRANDISNEIRKKNNLTVSSDEDDYSQGRIDHEDDEFEDLLLLAAALDDKMVDLMFLRWMNSRRDSKKRRNKV